MRTGISAHIYHKSSKLFENEDRRAVFEVALFMTTGQEYIEFGDDQRSFRRKSCRTISKPTIFSTSKPLQLLVPKTQKSVAWNSVEQR